MRAAPVLERAYEQGWVLDADGAERKLAPHSIEREDGEALRDLAMSEGASRTIEVGLALGMSALFLAEAAAEREGRHTAVDPFQEKSWNGAGLRTLREAEAGELVEVIEEESQIALPRLLSEDRSFDFAFVDGDHRFEGAFIDLYFMTRLVRPEGLVVVDDMWLPAVRMAVAYCELNLGLELQPGGFEWKRRRLRSGVPEGVGDTAVLRLPRERPELRWDEFVPPY